VVWIERTTIHALTARAVADAFVILNPSLGAVADAVGFDNALVSWVTEGTPDTHGLCGGMAFPAVDYSRAQTPLATASSGDDPPSRNTPERAAARSYLWTRMVDSLRTNAATFLARMAALHLLLEAWPFLGGPSWLRDQSERQWRALKNHIERGRSLVPRPHWNDTGAPSTITKVVAYGYEWGDRSGVIEVYEMNCPGRRQTIEVSLGIRTGWAESETCKSSTRVPFEVFSSRCIRRSFRLRDVMRRTSQPVPLFQRES
jgi:hypothetical protein